MPWTWASTWPNTTSHSTGCTARETISVGSRRSLISSTCATAALSRRNRSMNSSSTQAPSGPAGLDGVAEIAALADAAAGIVREHLVHGRAGAQPRAQPGRRSDDGDTPRVQNRKLVAQRFGFLHVVRRDQDRHAVVVPEVAQAVPHRMA